MSRTYRKPFSRWYDYTNKAVFVQEHLVRFYRPTRRKAVRKTKEQYEKDLAWAEKEYQKNLKERFKLSIYRNFDDFLENSLYVKYARKPYISRWNYIEVEWPIEEAIKEYEAEFDSLIRDGKYNETPRKSGFKKEAKRHVRRRNKDFCKKVMKDEWEDEAYPLYFEGKQFAWNWW